jgi:dipeptidyl aminopeptidase/acylaminoacyl peptidase
MKRKILFLAGILVLAGVVGYFWPRGKSVFISPEGQWVFEAKPWEKYSFPRLRERVFQPDGIWTEGDRFYYWVEGKKVSGQLHQPEGAGPFPVVVMLRGYVDRAIYQPGAGTRRAAEVFADNGYLTLAPDFLGYGESDPSFPNNLEDRFFHPVEVLQLIASLPNLPQADPDKVALWGHSNGGQIALSVLEISGQNYPTSLWAPVSKPFPYSILYYSDEAEDYGRALRQVVAAFEAWYNADEFSIHNYYDWIGAPVQLHQGTNDEAVPEKWSRELEKALKEKDKVVKLYVYPGADHNLTGGDDSWNLAVGRSLAWFAQN